MSRLTVCTREQPRVPLLMTEDGDEITRCLGDVGVRFERWTASRPLASGASQDDVLLAYAVEVERLKAEGGYQAADGIRLSPDHPQKVALRAKFLDEHTHAEDEVRFFVEGQGLFYLHIDQRVFMVLCCQGDLISVPADTTHWFDTGPEPDLTAVRLFTNPEGWVARYTGSDMATRFPKMDD